MLCARKLFYLDVVNNHNELGFGCFPAMCMTEVVLFGYQDRNDTTLWHNVRFTEFGINAIGVKTFRKVEKLTYAGIVISCKLDWVNDKCKLVFSKKGKRFKFDFQLDVSHYVSFADRFPDRFTPRRKRGH